MDRTGQIWVSYEYIFLIVDSQIEEWSPYEVKYTTHKIKHTILYLDPPAIISDLVEYPSSTLERRQETKRIL